LIFIALETGRKTIWTPALKISLKYLVKDLSIKTNHSIICSMPIICKEIILPKIE
jgi:hypothetical protein